MIALSEPREHLVADAAGRSAKLVDADAAAEQGGKVAAPRAAVGQVGHVDRQKVHRYAADDRAALAGDDRLRTRLAFDGASRARIAVGVADRHDRKPAWPHRGEGCAV